MKLRILIWASRLPFHYWVTSGWQKSDFQKSIYHLCVCAPRTIPRLCRLGWSQSEARDKIGRTSCISQQQAPSCSWGLAVLTLSPHGDVWSCPEVMREDISSHWGGGVLCSVISGWLWPVLLVLLWSMFFLFYIHYFYFMCLLCVCSFWLHICVCIWGQKRASTS